MQSASLSVEKMRAEGWLDVVEVGFERNPVSRKLGGETLLCESRSAVCICDLAQSNTNGSGPRPEIHRIRVTVQRNYLARRLFASSRRSLLRHITLSCLERTPCSSPSEAVRRFKSSSETPETPSHGSGMGCVSDKGGCLTTSVVTSCGWGCCASLGGAPSWSFTDTDTASLVPLSTQQRRRAAPPISRNPTSRAAFVPRL